MPLSLFRQFIQLESASSLILFFATLLAILLANSPWHNSYQAFFNTPFTLEINTLAIKLSIIHLINEGLMTLFFLLVSLEIKRALLIGELSNKNKAFLPAFAAIGGMMMPAFIYAICNYKNTVLLQGWAIPTATDIAFSLGVLSLLSSKIPSSLKTFLTALAIIDDLGAIVIIALFYTAHIATSYLLFAGICFIFLLFFNYRKLHSFWPYAVVGSILWWCIFQSGVHSTIAGVIIGFTIPLRAQKAGKPALLQKIEHRIHPWIAYGILPLFALANAGLSFANLTANAFNSMTWGILLGLCLGKPVGILGASWLAVKSGYAQLPSKVHWQHFIGIALLGGIGFTMSLFIGTLAFPDATTALTPLIRTGVMAGSLLSGFIGYLFLRFSYQSK